MNLPRLLQLASPTLPVGAYSYSQGLEAAVEAGIVTDAASAEAWIADALDFSIGRFEAPVLWRMLQGEALNDRADGPFAEEAGGRAWARQRAAR
jgi:urease accessory protein